MKYLLLFTVLGFAACNDADITKTDSTSEPIFIGPTEARTADRDPYFIETKDTVSTHGPGNITRSMLQDKNGHPMFILTFIKCRIDNSILPCSFNSNKKYFYSLITTHTL